MQKIIIFGRIPSKKNSKIISCRGSRPMMFPSAKHKEWHTDASKQLTFIKPIPPLTKLTFTYFAPDSRKGDLSNKWESVADLLVDLKIIEDDNWFILNDVHMKFGGIDKDEPRGEIEYV